MFQMLQSQNYGLQQVTRLESFMCIQKLWKERMKNNSNHSNIYYLLTLK
jgi:hypothetical protein